MNDTLLLIWITSIIITVIISSRKGETLGGFLVGCVFGPLGILFALGSAGRKRIKPRDNGDILPLKENNPEQQTVKEKNDKILSSQNKPSIGEIVMYLFSVVFRLLWSLTIGLVFFLVGLILFIILDILMPNSDKGYRVLNNMYKWGSCYWFKGLKMVTDDFEVDVSKKRKEK